MYHEHKHQAPAAPRANLDNISEGLQHNQRTVRKAERALAVSVAPAQPLSHEKVNAAKTRPEKTMPQFLNRKSSLWACL